SAHHLEAAQRTRAGRSAALAARSSRRCGPALTPGVASTIGCAKGPRVDRPLWGRQARVYEAARWRSALQLLRWRYDLADHEPGMTTVQATAGRGLDLATLRTIPTPWTPYAMV